MKSGYMFQPCRVMIRPLLWTDILKKLRTFLGSQSRLQIWN